MPQPVELAVEGPRVRSDRQEGRASHRDIRAEREILGQIVAELVQLRPVIDELIG